MRNFKRSLISLHILCLFYFYPIVCSSDTLNENNILNIKVANYIARLKKIERLKNAYPDFIKEVSNNFITWHDGTLMKLFDDTIKDKSEKEKLENPCLYNQIETTYICGIPEKIAEYAPINDCGRIRYESFFRKMYGNSQKEVEANLVVVDWMPMIFGMGTHRLRVTRINGINEKITKISQELEKLVQLNPQFKEFLDSPGGTFCWRVIANTNRLSPHSFGMTIDINAQKSQYWQWDLKNAGLPINEYTELKYKNQVPWQIVQIFEKYGFIWGGKWYHYDTMHFEYRPELFDNL